MRVDPAIIEAAGITATIGVMLLAAICIAANMLFKARDDGGEL